jgi:hypothetical protein
MPPVGAVEPAADVPDDEAIAEGGVPEVARPKPAARRRPAARKSDKSGD